MIKESNRNNGLKWYYKNRESQIIKNRKWKEDNHEQMLEQKKEYHFKNRDSILIKKKEYRENNDDIIKQYRINNKERDHKTQKEYRKNNVEKEKKRHEKYNDSHKKEKAVYNKVHSQIPKVKARRNETSRIRNRLHPRSNRSGTIELQLAMNNVRIRDNQTCQWYNCGLTHRESPIHVHHIFPTSEYPDYEEIEQYMICYCANHHGMFHRYRGDKYANFIGANVLVNGRGRD